MQSTDRARLDSIAAFSDAASVFQYCTALCRILSQALPLDLCDVDDVLACIARLNMLISALPHLDENDPALWPEARVTTSGLQATLARNVPCHLSCAMQSVSAVCVCMRAIDAWCVWLIVSLHRVHVTGVAASLPHVCIATSAAVRRAVNAKHAMSYRWSQTS